MNILKKIRTPYISILFAYSLLLASCSQYENDDQSSRSSNTIQTSESYKQNFRSIDKTERWLTDSEIKEIGEAHNKALNSILTKENGDYVQDISELKTNIINKNPDLLSNDSEINSIVDNSTSLSVADFDLMVELNPKLVNDATTLKNFVHNAAALTNDYSNYDDFTNSLHELDDKARLELKGTDLDTYLLFSSVQKNSVHFWFEQDHYNKVLKAKPTRSGVATADGLSAAIGFLTLAAVTAGLVVAAGSGGLATPAIVLIMEIVGIGFGAALSSGAYLLGVG